MHNNQQIYCQIFFMKYLEGKILARFFAASSHRMKWRKRSVRQIVEFCSQPRFFLTSRQFFLFHEVQTTLRQNYSIIKNTTKIVRVHCTTKNMGVF
jgi:hypothetical protein